MNIPKNKVVILKRNVNGKLKSLLAFNGAGEHVRLSFTDDEKLDRVVAGNEKENIVAWDRVGEHYVIEPLTDKFRLDTNGDGRFWCYLKNSNKSPGTENCLITAEGTGNLSIQNAEGFTCAEIQLGKSGRFLGIKDRSYGPFEVIEHNITADTPTPTQAQLLLQQRLKDTLSR